MEKESTNKITYRIKVYCGKITEHLDRVPMERMAVYAGILFVLSLIPLLILGRYSVMCIDDYDYGRRVHDTWLTTGSVWQSVQTAWKQNMTFYREWQGTYISCFLMALCPTNFKYEIGWIVPVFMIGIFSVAVFILGRHILCKWLGAEKACNSFIVIMMLFMYYQVMEAPFEGIYWYNGAVHYVLMESILLFGLTALSACIWTDRKSKEVLLCTVSAVLAVIVGGGNLVTGLQAEIVMTILIIYTVAVNRRKIIAAVIPFMTGSIGFLFNIMAPGNAQRSALSVDTGYPAVMSVLLSFYHAVAFVIRWTPTCVILIWLMLLPVLWKAVKRSDKAFRHPMWVTLGALCVLAAMFTPTLYAVGAVGLARVDNIIQMVYYLCLVTVTAYWLGYLAHREGCEIAASDIETETVAGVGKLRAGDALGIFLDRAGHRMTAVCLLAVLVIWIFTADKNTYTSVSALRSLVKGEAQTFYTEAMERYEVYIDDTITDVEVRPYSVVPDLFDINDLTADPGNWLNLAVAGYYHKAYVKVVDE